MHEVSVCQGLMRQVMAIAAEHGATRVERIVLHIGPQAGIDPQLLADAFPFASAETLAEGAELVIETLPSRVRCRQCGAEGEAAPEQRVCGHCGGPTQLQSGNEMLLASVDLSGGSLSDATAAMLN